MKFFGLYKLLVQRELTLRYKRSVLGIGWSLINPMLTSFVLWIVFSFIFASKLSNGQQYAPYLMAGILTQNLWSQGLTSVAESIANNGSILSKVKVPPRIFGFAAASAAMVNFFIGLIPLTLVVYISGQKLSPTFPLSVIVAISLALLVTGLGLMLSVLFIRFDDMRNVIGIILFILIYLTPIYYPISALNPTMQKVVTFNPLTNYFQCFRWAFSANDTASIFNWSAMILTSAIAFILGQWVFKRAWTRTVAML